MNGRVHTAIGVATGLTAGAVIPQIRPDDVLSLSELIAFAVAGSLIPDIDMNGTGKVKKTATTAVALTAIVAAWIIRSGRTDIIKYFDVRTIAGGLLFIICLVAGLITKHRTFTHSILGLALFSVSIYLLFTPTDTIFFALAMLMHQLFDMLNMTKVAWLYPMKGGAAAGFCKSDGFVAEMFGLIFTLLCGVLLYLYFTKGFIQ